MTNLTKTLLGATAFLALATSPATAEEYDSYDREIIDQVQLGNVWSNINVYVPSTDGDIVTSSAAVGNAATAIVDDGNLSVQTNQTLQGAVGANTNIWAGSVERDVIASTSATGNSNYTGNWYGNADVDTDQQVSENVTATSHVDVAEALAVSAHSTAVANSTFSEVDYADRAEVFNIQNTTASVFSGSTVVATSADEFVQNTAIAAGNSADTAFDSVGEAFSGAVQTTAEFTTIVSSADTFVGSAEDVITTSAAVGNQFTGSQVDSYAQFGAKGSESFQGNGAGVFANADTTVDSFSGIASSSANGVGNSFAVSGLGGQTSSNVIQTNFGQVGTNVTLNTGDFSGGTGIANATSTGNSFSSIAQDGGSRNRVEQTNFSNIGASASVRTGRIGGNVVATSTAIGNTATIENRRGN